MHLPRVKGEFWCICRELRVSSGVRCRELFEARGRLHTTKYVCMYVCMYVCTSRRKGTHKDWRDVTTTVRMVPGRQEYRRGQGSANPHVTCICKRKGLRGKGRGWSNGTCPKPKGSGPPFRDAKWRLLTSDPGPATEGSTCKLRAPRAWAPPQRVVWHRIAQTVLAASMASFWHPALHHFGTVGAISNS